MFIKKLPCQEQALLIASSRINTRKKAVEELVYNSLDAEATSIAIRVNIDQSSIQVIDNGCGITKIDMDVVGQRHMTSKYTENSNLKAIPSKYGLRGESLANIVEISKTIKISSKHENSDECWEKVFRNGKSIIKEVNKRPSKGSTVEIKGLLYNRYIQTKSINSLNELQEIKIFLEQISLVHNNISLSLRDDSKNEIVFQVHKKRDVYQTLSSLYSINKSEIQEFKVEKNEYAVTAFIANNFKNIYKDWIFLNRKIVDNSSRLHKIVNDNLNKYLKNQCHRKKLKIKYDDEEIYRLKDQLPFYCMFIQCPFNDYDVIDKLVEFSDWNQITKLLEKLVKFYLNDINLKTISHDDISIVEMGKQSANTREQVKKIINKILANNPKTIGVSQMRNGIKGKISKRKKKQTSVKNNSQSKLTSKYGRHSIKDIDCNNDRARMNKVLSKSMLDNEFQGSNFNLIKDKSNKTIRKSSKGYVKDIKRSKPNHDLKKIHLQELGKNLGSPKEIKTKAENNDNYFYKDPIIKQFINPKDSVKRRCEILAQKAQNILDNLNKKKYESYCLDKSIQCNYSNKSIDIYKKPKHKNDYDNTFLPQKLLQYKIEQMHIKTANDLLKTVMSAQIDKSKIVQKEQSVLHYKNTNRHEFKSNDTSRVIQNGPIMSQLTYESHSYEMITRNNLRLWKPNNLKCISKKSTDKSIKPDSASRLKMCQQTVRSTYSRQLKERTQTLLKNNSHINKDSSMVYRFMPNTEEYSQKVSEVSKSNLIYYHNNTSKEANAFLSNFTISNCVLANDNENILFKTYTLPGDYDANNKSSPLECIEPNQSDIALSCNSNDEYIRKTQFAFSIKDTLLSSKKKTHDVDDLSIICIPESQLSRQKETLLAEYAPIDVCEAVYFRNDVFEKEFEFSFNNSNKQRDVDVGYDGSDINSKQTFCEKDKDYEIYNTQNHNVNSSHHFNIDNMSNSLKLVIGTDDKAMTSSVVDKQITDFMEDNNHNDDQLKDKNQSEKCESIDSNAFNLKNRLRFVPKGMSPIFKSCQTIQVCNYNHNMDYYEDNLYHNFVNEVKVNSRIYEEQVQNIKDQSKNVDKWKNIINDNDISLDFNGRSLEDAIILNQVDNKFIAAIIKNHSEDNVQTAKFLVLFDQHAVHERIRLENNMTEYFTDGQWRSVAVDSMTILLPKEDLLYLHNYKDKFAHLGLQWTMSSSNEISISAIPEAILGKNPRQVNKIISAVRRLFTEQINNIRSQNGCMAVYPKSIMDLVFSEACRYAIMFGDKLTKDRCEELIKGLSKCKKPFQCAHGRPVMAVVMDLEDSKSAFKANLSKLKRFKK